MEFVLLYITSDTLHRTTRERERERVREKGKATSMPGRTTRRPSSSGHPSPRSNPSSVMREMTPSPRYKGVASGFNVPTTMLSRELELIVCCLGVFISFSYFAVMQEDVYVVQPNGERFSMTFFALVFERTVNALCALVAIFVFGGSGYKLPLKDIFRHMAIPPTRAGISARISVAGAGRPCGSKPRSRPA